MIEEINQMINPLKKPQYIELIIFQERSLHAEHRSESILLPLTYGYTDDNGVNRSKTWKYYKLILAHEYGHALFELNLALRMSAANGLHKHLILEGKINKVIDEADQEQNSLRKQQLEIQLQETEYQIRKNLAESPDALRLRNIWSPYHEFFADLVAVLYAGDGKAIFKALKFRKRLKLENLNQDINELKNVDFTRKVTLDTWTPTTGQHDLFSPSRSIIWEIYRSRPEFQARKGAFLDRVLNAIAEDLNETLLQAPKARDPVKMNETLIARLRLAFSDTPSK